MKKIIYTFAFASLSLSSFSQAGALDLTFDSDGRVVTSVGVANEEGHAVAVQADGKILVAGWNGEGTVNNNFMVIRYNSNGSIDGSFGVSGVAIADFAGDDDRAYAIALQPDGKILVGGSCNAGPDPSMGLVRLNTDGSPDNTFDGDGILSFNYGTTNDWITELAVQPDGKIIAAGNASNFTTGDYLVVRFNTNGTLDTSFDGDGFAIWDIGGDDFCNAMVLQADGKIVLGGTSGSTTSDTDFCIARLNANGSQDSGFGTVVSNFGSTGEEIFALALQGDGKIVAGGYSHNGSNYDFAVIRYLTDGSIDVSFDTDGYLIQPIGSDDDVARGLEVQSDGKIVVGGTAYGTNTDFALLRLNANGTPDNSFDGDGIATADFGGGFDDAFGMTLQPDGKILLTGDNQNSTWDVATARFNAAGSVEIAEYDASSVSVFPNPAKDQLHMANTKADAMFSIHDITGRKVCEGKCCDQQTSFDTSGLNPGCYLLDYSDGDHSFHTKFTKQ